MAVILALGIALGGVSSLLGMRPALAHICTNPVQVGGEFSTLAGGLVAVGIGWRIRGE